MKRIIELGGLDGHQWGKSYQTGYKVYGPDGISPAILADGGGYGIMIVEEQKLGNLYGYTGGNFAGNVYSKDGLCPGLLTMQGGNKQPMIVENKSERQLSMRAKVMDDGSIRFYKDDKRKSGISELQIQSENGIADTITTNDHARPRIRKLTPRECWRLMGYTDRDFDRASSVNSNSQLYKEAGNAIVKQVLMAIFSQLNIKGVTPWNEVHK